MANKEQVEILKRSTKEWLEYRMSTVGLPGIVKVDLSGADLRNCDLRGAALSNANLRGANLRGAKLQNADLTEADLTMADLSMANLSRAVVYDADFTNAKFGTLGIKALESALGSERCKGLSKRKW
jgi:uncharacterized protein YjbI with pentapeptide repeats